MVMGTDMATGMDMDIKRRMGTAETTKKCIRATLNMLNRKSNRAKNLVNSSLRLKFLLRKSLIDD